MHTNRDTTNGNYFQVGDLFDSETIFDRYNKNMYVKQLYVIIQNSYKTKILPCINQTVIENTEYFMTPKS